MDLLFIVGYLTVFSAAAGCQFGRGCQFPCHCQNNATCDGSTGKCPRGCDDGDPNEHEGRGAWSGPGCQVGNVAYGRDTFFNNPPPGATSKWAVDGNWDPVLENHHCTYVETGMDWQWVVDLGSEHVIQYISAIGTNNKTGKNSWKDRLVYVDDVVCGELGEHDDVDAVNVTCPFPLRGQRVIINSSRNPNTYSNTGIILCEVMIYGYKYVECPRGMYGPGCLTQCNCNGNCNVIDGDCITEKNTLGQETLRTTRSKQQTVPTFPLVADAGMGDTNATITTDDVEYKTASIMIAVQVTCTVILLLVVFFLARWRWHHKKQRAFTATNGPAMSFSDIALDLDGRQTIGHSPCSTPSEKKAYNHLVACSEKRLSQHSLGITDCTRVQDSRFASDGSLCVKEAVFGRPIKVRDLHEYVQEMKNRLNASKFEYMEIPWDQHASWDVAMADENKGKNRFLNILAYDHSRVKLQTENEATDVDYINANFIPAYKDIERGYIATQGPMPHTVVDFWHMIWDYNVNRVVMLTKVWESGKAKCEYYWPEAVEDELPQRDFDGFYVTLEKEDHFAEYVIRTLSVTKENVYNKNTAWLRDTVRQTSRGKSAATDCRSALATDFHGERRTVRQFQFLGWPDHGVPQVATSVLDFYHKVRSYDHYSTGPLVVHCSAGVGRTGAFIAIDFLLEQAKAEGEIDLYRYTTLMRTRRVNMIQTLAQYKFVYVALSQALMSGDTEIPAHQMASKLPSLLVPEPGQKHSVLSLQFQVLEDIRPWQSEGLLDGLRLENVHKNRNNSPIPSDYYRPYLLSNVGTGTNYINAAFITGYRGRRAYIATQMPLSHTVNDFWHLVYDHGPAAIILLHNCEDSETEEELCPRYWPEEVGERMDFDPLEVEMEAEEKIATNIIWRQFRLSNNKKADSAPHVVRQFHLHGWHEEAPAPDEPEVLLRLLGAVTQWEGQSRGGPIMVQCKNGVQQTGIVCAAKFIVEKIEADKEVDVFLAVAQTRLSRPRFVVSLEQYIFLHLLAEAYIEKQLF